ncbi:hypothetical protein B0H12DRAFT_1223214 [Mycena haematopus]|nr:hypothetical protein B0H12DRAFT_1223214 [Mycena haematopus]
MLLTLPPELIHQVALHLATGPPNLGPPAAVLPLLVVCKRLYALLGWSRNRAFWARVACAKFTFLFVDGYVPYAGYPYVGLGEPEPNSAAHDRRGRGRAGDAAQGLRTRCAALGVIRRGDPFAVGAARALRVAYGMLLEDEWAGDRLDWTQLDIALGRTPTSTAQEEEEYRPGKNRRQLAWAGARAFALRYVRERLYVGRYGDWDDPATPHHAEVASERRPEWAEPAWRVGWPRDAEGTAAALWVLWFFESDAALRAEDEALRRHVMSLLLPLIVAPFRYASALAPPHHYTVPLLPAAYAESRPITVPTHHGAYPIYPLGAPHPHASHDTAKSRLLCAPPARLLFFARMQVGARMDVPPQLPRTRADAEARWRADGNANGGTGRMPICPTQQDVHEKNARPVVRFERPLFGRSFASITSTSPSTSTSTTTTSPSTSTPNPTPASTPTTATISTASLLAHLAVPPELDAPLDLDGRRRGHDRWAAQRWRARLCRGYGGGASSDSTVGSAVSVGSAAGVEDGDGAAQEAAIEGAAQGVRGIEGGREGRGGNQGLGGAPPGRIGRVYALGSFAGLWAGTMLMPSEPPYTALVASPTGALPAGGLPRNEFVAAARPVYMRVREHWRNLIMLTLRLQLPPKHAPPPPPADSTTADEGLRTGWLPPGTRVVGVGGGTVEVRVPWWEQHVPGFHGQGHGEVYTYHTALVDAAAHAAHDTDRCGGCVRVRGRERWMRGVAAGEAGAGAGSGAGSGSATASGSASGSGGSGSGSGSWGGEEEDVAEEDVEEEEEDDDEEGREVPAESEVSSSSPPSPSFSQHHDDDVPTANSDSPRSSRTSDASLRNADSHSSPPKADSDSSPNADSDARSSRNSDTDPSPRTSDEDASPRTSNDAAPWPEWDTPAWAAHRFDDDEGWEGQCDGVQDVIFEGETDAHHGMAWHHYEYAGRVRPWDGLIGLVMRPRDRTLGLATFFISGNLVGRDTFEGTWQMAAQDAMAPSWGGSVCLARGEDVVDLNYLSRHLTESSARVRELENELANTKTDLHAQLSSFRDKLMVKSERLDVVNAVKQECRDKYTKLQAQLNNSADLADRVLRERLEAEKALDDTRRECADLQAAVTEGNGSNERHTAAYVRLKDKFDRVKEDRNNLRESCAELTNDKKELQQTLLGMIELVERLQEDSKERRETANSDLSSRVRELELEKADLHTPSRNNGIG